MLLLELLKALFFGIVEGITEWLPISSTGHLILAQEFIRFNQSKSFIDMFNIVIQLGAILAVMVIYFKRLNPFYPGKSKTEIKYTWNLWLKVLIACIPSAIFGLLLDDWMEEHFYNFIVVAIVLILYGFAFIWIEKRHNSSKSKINSIEHLSYQIAFLIGCFQVLAIIPGTSRSGATILGAILLGTSRSIAADFTFFLAIPTMFGYSSLKAVKFFLDGNTLGFDQLLILILSSITAFLVSLYAIKFLTNYVKKHDFTIFGKYRIVLGIILITYWITTIIF